MEGADEGRSFDEVEIGESLPPFAVALTLQRLVMEAGANRDFSRIHHDPGLAEESGAPGAYANTTFVESLLEAGIRSWAGPGPRIRVLEFSMVAFNVVGDEVASAGTVTGKDADERTIEVDLWVQSPDERTVTGMAILQFPA